MTVPCRLPTHHSNHSSLGKNGAVHMEKSYRKCGVSEEVELARFGRLLWRAFPEARSEHDLSEIAAAVLSTEGRNVHPKTVRNWLHGDNAPHFRYVIRVLALAGAESVFELIDPEAAA